ncbi:MAG: amino acid adenylation domain-containing protein [Chloroflexi bacterium]|nr:amino acid adenylation domain-containing protein [Chloroflexota bacterium]
MSNKKTFGSCLSLPRIHSLVDLLRERTQQNPDFCTFTFLTNGENEEATLTNTQLDSQARSIAARLQAVLPSGERALLLYPPSLDYITAFFGCLYAGVIAVPAYPPNPAALQRTLPRLQAIIQDAQASVVLTTEPILSMASFLFAQAPDLQSLQWIATDVLDITLADQWQAPNINANTTAFLQYTSGSTGDPKGVILSHGNLFENLADIHRCFGHHADSQGVIWLPPYHDMGLIGGILQPLYGDFPVTLLSPLDFLKRPLRWLEAISKYRATTSGGPNFAYDLCVRKVMPEQLETLDLSSWDLAFNGAEPIRPNSLRQFTDTFKQCGFRYDAFYPCYGLAEATLIASGGEKAEAPILQPAPNTPAPQTDDPSQMLISCGRTLPRQSIVIANPQTRQQCAAGDIGEIWVSGPSVAQGYWGKTEATAVTFQAYLADNNAGPFLRTGDLGFMQEGELYVTGRLKDLVIIRGRNHYPQDIEMTTEQAHPALRLGCSAAFAITAADAEQLIVVVEVDQRHPDLDPEAVAQTVRERIAIAHDVQPHAVVLIKARSIPKTSSGKIQRYACREQFLDDTLEVVTANIVELVSKQTAVSEPSFLLKSLQTITDNTARQTLLTIHLQQQIAQALHAPTAQIAPDRALTSYGMDSLQSIELAAEVEQLLGITVPMTLLLQEMSLSTLSSQLLTRLDENPEPIKPTIAAAATGTFPLSEGQKALWYLYQLAPNSTAYNLPRAVRIHSELDIDAMRRALSQLVNRHTALRTTFGIEDGSPMQVAHDFLAPDLEVVSANTWSDQDLLAQLTADAERPFDLKTGPLMRVRIYERGDETAVLLLVLHHIITDFWSLVILVNELSQLYMAERDQKPIQLPELPVQYPDFVQWQQQMLQTPVARQNRSYWQQQLAGMLPTLNLPLDRPRPPVQTYNGAHRHFRLDKLLSQKLLTFARQVGVTPYMLMLAAYNVLLSRYSGQSEIIVGSPTTGRDTTAWLRSFGYFVNPVAIRSHIQPDTPFTDFLQVVRQTALAAFAHQQYPFPLLVDDLDLPRNPSHSPIFQTLFAWQKAQQTAISSQHDNLTGFALGIPDVSFQVNNLWLSSVELMQQASQFDITLMMGEVESQVAGVFEYNTDLFDATTIDRMIGHWQTLLQNIVAGPQTAVSRIPLLTPAETQTVLQTWNDTHVDYGDNVCLHDLFVQQVARTPDAPALVYGDQTLTYTELNGRVNQLAHHLQSLGVQPETLVGVCIDRSLEMVIALYAILKAGGAYVPIDPQLPQERITFMLTDTNTPVLLTQSSLKAAGTLTAVNAQTHILCLDTEWEQVAGYPTGELETAVKPHHLAYTIYTSGSTGQPKGAMNTHQGIVNRLRWMQTAYQLDASDTVLQKTPFSFDVSVWEFFWPLMTGAQLVIARPGGHLDSAYLRDTINAHTITTIHFVPSMLQIFLGEPGIDSCTGLRRVICSGEALPTDLQDRFFASLPQVELHNLYGPTEAAIDVTYWQCQPGQNVPIGRPIDNIQLYILDAEHQPVPIGVAGELHIGGVGVARTYLNRPGLTADKFIPNPFSILPGDRLYKTGDLARYRPDGNIEYLGRIDFQVKVRGFRVELGEIETRLTDHPDIKEAIVTIHNADSIDQRLVAYIIPQSATSTLTSANLRTYLQDKLPEYMVPSLFAILEMLPLMPNGKVNRRALPAPQLTRADLHTTYAAPRNVIEQQIAEIWQKNLQVEKVGLYDNFFDLGGHSLLLVQVHRQLQETLAREIPLVKLLEHPTVQGVAHYLNQGQRDETQALQKSAARAQKQRDTRRRNRGGRN